MIGVWGLAFKPNTDDMREAPAVVLIRKLIEVGARVQAYDPIAMTVAKRTLPQQWLKSGVLKLAQDQYAALKGADALALVTEWKPFRSPDLHLMKKNMRQQVIFDGRNQYEKAAVMEQGFEYRGIGR